MLIHEINKSLLLIMRECNACASENKLCNCSQFYRPNKIVQAVMRNRTPEMRSTIFGKILAEE